MTLLWISSFPDLSGQTSRGFVGIHSDYAPSAINAQWPFPKPSPSKGQPWNQPLTYVFPSQPPRQLTFSHNAGREALMDLLFSLLISKGQE